MIIAIKPVSIWYQGASVSCDTLVVESTRDNLTDFADIYYGIGTSSESGINQGTLLINGTDYQQWNAQTSVDANTWIGDWVLAQLNLTRA
jgi:hypothetical protein